VGDAKTDLAVRRIEQIDTMTRGRQPVAQRSADQGVGEAWVVGAVDVLGDAGPGVTGSPRSPADVPADRVNVLVRRVQIE
jgi:hypothetical protein